MRSVSAPGRPASLALTDKPERLLVAIEGRLAFLDWTSATWTDWIVLEAADLRNRLNDGRCDPAGRFWVGSMSDPAIASGDGPRPATGLLHRVEADGAAVTVRSGIGVTNGLAFAPDGRTMYFADTHRDTVWAYDYDVSTGEATNERVFLDFESTPGQARRRVRRRGRLLLDRVRVRLGRPAGDPHGHDRSAGRRPRPEADDAGLRRPRPVDAVHHLDRWGRVPRDRPGAAGSRRASSPSTPASGGCPSHAFAGSPSTGPA